MADTTKSILSLVATTSSRIRELTIKDGQLVFLQDVGRIAFDYKGTRVFYNQIVELETEADRLMLDSPLDGYYFVIGSCCLWFYKSGWTQITEKPQEILFVGEEILFPKLGQEDKLYINNSDGKECISVWNENFGNYQIVADKTQEVSDKDIEDLFK